MEAELRATRKRYVEGLISEYRLYPETPLSVEANGDKAARPDVERDGTLPIWVCAALVLQRSVDRITTMLPEMDGGRSLDACEQALRLDLARFIRNKKDPRKEHRLEVGRVLEWAEHNGEMDHDTAAKWAGALGELVQTTYHQAKAERDQGSAPEHGNTAVHAAKREAVLRAALAVLAHRADECRTKGGKVQATKLATAVELHCYPIFGDDPPLERSTMEKLFRDCLNSFM